jgi:hypothetical protein
MQGEGITLDKSVLTVVADLFFYHVAVKLQIHLVVYL